MSWGLGSAVERKGDTRHYDEIHTRSLESFIGCPKSKGKTRTSRWNFQEKMAHLRGLLVDVCERLQAILGRPLRTTLSLPTPLAVSRSFVLARTSLRALHLDPALGSGRLAPCEATDRGWQPEASCVPGRHQRAGRRVLAPSQGWPGAFTRRAAARRWWTALGARGCSRPRRV